MSAHIPSTKSLDDYHFREYLLNKTNETVSSQQNISSCNQCHPFISSNNNNRNNTTNSRMSRVFWDPFWEIMYTRTQIWQVEENISIIVLTDFRARCRNSKLSYKEIYVPNIIPPSILFPKRLKYHASEAYVIALNSTKTFHMCFNK